MIGSPLGIGKTFGLNAYSIYIFKQEVCCSIIMSSTPETHEYIGKLSPEALADTSPKLTV